MNEALLEQMLEEAKANFQVMRKGKEFVPYNRRVLELMEFEKKFDIDWLHQRWECGILPSVKHYIEVPRGLQDRLLFPVRDAHGKLVSIFGRRIFPNEQDTGKFWHVSYEKRYHLWGLYRFAGKDALKTIPFLVESYFDVVALDKLGYHGVAMMGSSLRIEQALLLTRYTDRIIFIPHRDKITPLDLNKVRENLHTVGITVLTFPAPAEDFAAYYAQVGPLDAGLYAHWLQQEFENEQKQFAVVAPTFRERLRRNP